MLVRGWRPWSRLVSLEQPGDYLLGAYLYSLNDFGCVAHSPHVLTSGNVG